MTRASFLGCLKKVKSGNIGFALDLALKQNREHMFRVAVKHIDSRRDLRIALGSAIRFSKPGMATLILRKDKSIVNFPDDNGSNPLQAAACEGNIQMVRFLIESGADVRKQDRRGDLPIHCAVNHVYKCPENRIAIVKTLVQHGANINDRVESGDERAIDIIDYWIRENKRQKAGWDFKHRAHLRRDLKYYKDIRKFIVEALGARKRNLTDVNIKPPKSFWNRLFGRGKSQSLSQTQADDQYDAVSEMRRIVITLMKNEPLCHFQPSGNHGSLRKFRKNTYRLVEQHLASIVDLVLRGCADRSNYTRHFQPSDSSDVLSVSFLDCRCDSPQAVIARMFPNSHCPYWDWVVALGYESVVEMKPIDWRYHIHVVFVAFQDGFGAHCGCFPGLIPEESYRQRMSDSNAFKAWAAGLFSPGDQPPGL